MFPFAGRVCLVDMTQVEEVVARRQFPALRGALGVAAVTAGTFTVVTSEMLPVGLLTPIGAALRVTEGRAGLALTVTGSVAALSAPLLTAALRRVERRLVLCGLMAVLALGNLGTACAPGFGVLIGARVLVGIGMGGVWAIAASLAARLVPARSVPAATSLIFSGVAVASVLGIPAGTFLGALAGWRMAFVAAACLALAVLVAMAALLPRLPATEALPLRGVLRLTRQPGLRVALLVVAFLVTGHFAAYTYVRPVLEEVTGVDAATIGTLLLVYGIAGVAGNFAAGAVAARTPRGTLIAIGSILAAAAIALPALGVSLAQAVVLMIVWGVSYGGVSVSAQSWVFAASPQARESASALFAGVFNAAIALGSLTGGVAADGIGVAAAMWLGGTLAVVAVLVAALGKGARRS
ncbi:MFS transporter [Nocardia sputorum]|uniref:MFS transporter n=2 Tax=Nocardia sputorum TaxID=2984338 RepID=A0ABM8CTU2_9NOCA|nr:MFS transporter [Nocardia sputorum]